MSRLERLSRNAISMTNLSAPSNTPVVIRHSKPKRPRFMTTGCQTVPIFYMEAAEMLSSHMGGLAKADNLELQVVDGEVAKEKLKEIFYSLSWLNLPGATLSPSHLKTVTPTSPDSVFYRQLSFPKKTNRFLVSAKRKMSRESSIEEELGERLANMAEIARLWRQKCKAEREDNIRLCDHLYSCERRCHYLIDDMAHTYEHKLLETEEKVIRALEVQEKLIHEKASLQEDCKYRIERLENIKKQLEDKAIDTEKQAGIMKDDMFKLKKDNLTLHTDIKTQRDNYEKKVWDLNQIKNILEDKNVLAEYKIKELKGEMGQIEEENTLLTTENRTYRKENECLIRELIAKGKHMESKSKELIIEMGKLKDDLAQLREGNLTLNDDNQCYKEENHRLLEEFSLLKMELEKSELDLGDIRRELYCRNSEYEQCQCQLNDAVCKYDMCQSELQARQKEDQTDLCGMLLDMALNRLNNCETNWSHSQYTQRKSSPVKKGSYVLQTDPSNPINMSIEAVTKQHTESMSVEETTKHAPVYCDADSEHSDASTNLSAEIDEILYEQNLLPMRHRTFSDPTHQSDGHKYGEHLQIDNQMNSSPITRTTSGSLFPSSDRVKIRNRSLRRNVLSLSVEEMMVVKSTHLTVPSGVMSGDNMTVSLPMAVLSHSSGSEDNPSSPEPPGDKDSDTSTPHVTSEPQITNGKTDQNHNPTNSDENTNSEQFVGNNESRTRCKTMDVNYTKPLFHKLARRSNSQKELLKDHELNTLGKRRTRSQKALPKSSPNSSSEDLARTRGSGFGALRSRRNGITDIEIGFGHQLQSVKRSKSKDFGDIIRMLSRDQGNINKQMSKKRSKSQKKL